MKPYTLLIMFLSISFSSFSQSGYTFSYTSSNFGIKTPKGTNIESARLNAVYYQGSTYSDYPNPVKIAQRELFENNPANANKKVIGDITATYNCHSYAWNLAEGGDIIHWINAYSSSQSSSNDNLSQYWGINGGYTEVSNRTNAVKIYYSDGDHSAAITTQHNDTVISKWGKSLLVKHHYLDCPYTLTNLKYYKLSNPTISGFSTALCNNVQRTYSESGFSDIDLEYNWGFTGPLTEVSDNDTTTYTVRGISSNGEGTITLKVTTPSGATASTSKTVWVGASDNLSISSASVCGNSPIEINAFPDLSNLNYQWSIGGGTITSGQGSSSIMVDPNCRNNDLYIRVKAINDCGSSPEAIKHIPIDCSGATPLIVLQLSPNPTSGETTISIASEDKTRKIDDIEWEMEIYDWSKALKAKQTKIRSNQYKISTSHFPTGFIPCG